MVTFEELLDLMKESPFEHPTSVYMPVNDANELLRDSSFVADRSPYIETESHIGRAFGLEVYTYKMMDDIVIVDESVLPTAGDFVKHNI